MFYKKRKSEVTYRNAIASTMSNVEGEDEIINKICEIEKVEIHEIMKKSKIQKYLDIRKVTARKRE